MEMQIKRKISVVENSNERIEKKRKPPDLMMQKVSYKLSKSFFDVPCYNLAHFLLGKLLVRQFQDNTFLKARIVETECYLGAEDKASHSFGGRQTPRNEPMYMEAGTAYVYMTYGLYFCFNISSMEPGSVVLIRALDPIEGCEKMCELRATGSKRKTAPPSLQSYAPKELCNGPAKLCISFDITKAKFNKENLCDSNELWVETDPDFNEEIKIVKTSRIGIDSAGEEWAKKPLRFYILGNRSVSKRDRKAEENLLNSV